MKYKSAIGFLLVFFVVVSFAYAGESVTFKGTNKKGDSFMLKGILDKPLGQGPFPAIVMLSGGRGFLKAHDRWINRFLDWGYVALKVETLASRGFTDIFAFDISPLDAAQDAHDAKAYLSGLPFVDRNRIFLIGWAFGGWAVLPAIDPSVSFQNRGSPFRAAVAFYALCYQPAIGFDAPLLILHGELDDWHPVAGCRAIEGRGDHEIIKKIYPGAYTCFDLEGVDTTSDGHRLLYDPAAAADAAEQVKNFLAKSIK
jgi:dienelactone hydrolase